MKTLSEWLDRKPAGKKPRKRLPAVSARRKREGKLYLTKREAFIAAHPFCQVFIARLELVEAAVIQFNGHYIDVFGLLRRAPVATEVHHKSGRYGGNYLNESTWLAVCRDAHEWIHNNPSLARARGMLT